MKTACPLNVDNKNISVEQALETFSKPVSANRVRNFDVFGVKNVNHHLNAFFEQLTRSKIKASFSRDQIIIQAVKYAEELDFVISKVFERLFEWYGLYYPEATLKAESVEKFGKALKNGIDRESASKKLGINSESMGGSFSDKDLNDLEISINSFNHLIAERDRVKDYIERIVREIAPNASDIATPFLAAKLISDANGLRALAGMPSSTIQVMGAEKALFRHLTTGAKSPKYGIIFQHPLINKVKRENRGKIARTLANKISIAVKTDYYSPGLNVSKQLLKQINERTRKL